MAKATTITWRVYGFRGDFDETYDKSFRYDFSAPGDIRIIECENFDKTGHHRFAIVHITRNTPEECYDEFYGQITDGIFENYNVSEWQVVDAQYDT